MANALDMSLDDLIKKNKQPGRGGGRGRGRANDTSAGPLRTRASLRSVNRAAPYSLSKPFQQAPESAWQHDLFDAQMTDAAPSTRLLRIETGTKVTISNLDYGVSNDDIKELFSEVGDLKRHQVHYDRSGRSKGSAEVVFARRADAEAAVKRYHNVQLDGKPLKLEIVGTNLAIPAPNNQPKNWTAGNAIWAPMRGRGRGGAFQGSGGRGRGRGSGSGRGRGRGRGRASGEEKSAEDLDAELESYHAEAMQTN